MNKKVIEIIVIVVVLLLAGFFVYKIFAKKSVDVIGTGNTATTSAAPASTPSSILPYGTNLNFEPVNKFNPSNRTFNYPVVTEDQIGFNENELNRIISTQ